LSWIFAGILGGYAAQVFENIPSNNRLVPLLAEGVSAESPYFTRNIKCKLDTDRTHKFTRGAIGDFGGQERTPATSSSFRFLIVTTILTTVALHVAGRLEKIIALWGSHRASQLQFPQR
jgi:hypothetical protein